MRYVGQGLQNFVQASGFDVPAFKPRFPWYGADLQTLRNSFVSGAAAPEICRRLSVAVSGDMALSVAVTDPIKANGKALVLVHGLGGSEGSSYMKNTAAYFAAKGWAIYRMNYRGVGPSRDTSLPPYSAGLTGDMRAVLRAVSSEMGEVYAMGFSLGGQLLMRTLGEGDVPEEVKAVVTVSAPLDLASSQQKLERRRNAFYVNYLVGNMKADLEGVSHPSFAKNPKEVQSVLAFDEHIIAPYFGFENAQDYYRCVSCFTVLNKIDRPLLAIHASDDPWIPVEDYERAVWPGNYPVGALIVPGGGHVGFHAAGMGNAWFKSAASRFLERF